MEIDLLPDDLTPEDVLKMIDEVVAEQLGLREGTPKEQAAMLLKARDFENHHESLRIHFLTRIQIMIASIAMAPEHLEEIIGMSKIPQDLSWSQIDDCFVGLPELFKAHHPKSPLRDDNTDTDKSDPHETIAEIFGLPAESYDELIKCIKKGVAYEEEHSDMNKTEH